MKFSFKYYRTINAKDPLEANIKIRKIYNSASKEDLIDHLMMLGQVQALE